MASLLKRAATRLERLGDGLGLRRSIVDLARPIFIWGMARSGTTLLLDILSLYPGLCSVTVENRKQKGLWGDLHHGASTLPQPAGRPIPHEGFVTLWNRLGVPASWKGLLQPGDVPLDFEAIRGAYGQLAARWLWQAGTPRRILDKAIQYSLMTDTIDAVFPDAVHVFCIRDPRAVANSILRLRRFSRRELTEAAYPDGFHVGLYPPGWEALIGRPVVEVLAWQLEQFFRIGLERRHVLGERLILFRYEQLFTNLLGEVEGLANRLGLPPHPDLGALLLDQEIKDFSPAWPQSGTTFEASFDLAFSSEELPLFAGVERLARGLGYHATDVGRIVAPLDPGCVEG